MGKVAGNSAPEAVDELQRTLEIEIVNQLREQNALLMSELEELRRQRNSPQFWKFQVTVCEKGRVAMGWMMVGAKLHELK